MEKWITSVGIDIGTSTTKWIVSRLKLMKTSGGSSLPRYEIMDRKLIYVSPIYNTPLINELEMDMEALTQLLEQEYIQAGISPEMIDTGAKALKRKELSDWQIKSRRFGYALVSGKKAWFLKTIAKIQFDC